MPASTRHTDPAPRALTRRERQILNTYRDLPPRLQRELAVLVAAIGAHAGGHVGAVKGRGR